MDLMNLELDAEISEAGKEAVRLFSAGDLAGAEARCDEGLRINPADAGLLNLKAGILMQQRRHEEAMQFLDRCRAAHPSGFAAHLNTGNLLLYFSRVREARAMLESCVERKPDSAEAHYLLALSLLRLDKDNPAQIAQAREHFRRAAELKPGWATAHLCHGLACISCSRDMEAEAALRQALELKPDLTQAHYNLAYVLIEQDRSEEAIAPLRRALELDPKHQLARECLARLAPAERRSGRERLSRFPRAAAEFADMPALLKEYILTEFAEPDRFITANARVFTMGSCFARNIANGLRQYEVVTHHVDHAEEINSTFANRHLMEWLEGRDNPQTAPFQHFFGPQLRAAMTEAVRRADVVIISLGVAPCFFHRQSGEYASTLDTNVHVSLRQKEYVFRTTSVAENLANLTAIVDSLRRLRPGVRVVLTVSPVPLKATLERPSAIVADCVSKSILRVTAHEFMQMKIDKTLYWPSFEIVRWCSGHGGQAFGNDDGSPLHVSQELVKLIIDSFIRTFGDGEIVSRMERARSSEGAALKI